MAETGIQQNPSNHAPSPSGTGMQMISGEAVLDALKMVLLGAPLVEVLTSVTRLIEVQSPGMLCSIFLLDADGVHLRYGASRNRTTLLAEELLDSHAEAVVSQALALAEKVDAQMLRILLGHILPRRRELPLKTGPLPMGTAAELSQASQKLMNKVTSGQIGLSDAKGIADLLEHRRQILETENLEKRVRAIEQKTDEKEKDNS